MIGDSSTFKNARQGKEFWTQLFQLLEDGKHMYQGLPVKCQNHPQNTSILQTPEDFDEKCPEGGCLEPCDQLLGCGLHQCASMCHHVHDHSGIVCHVVMEKVCDRGKHLQRYECHESHEKSGLSCGLCEEEDEAEEVTKEDEAEEVAKEDRRNAEFHELMRDQGARH